MDRVGRQFNNPSLSESETPWKEDSAWGTTYRVHAPTDRDFAPGVELHVDKPRTGYEHGSHSSSQDTVWERGHIQLGDGPDGQRSLFGVVHKSPVASGLFAHPDYTAHVGTLLGVAALETKARYGEYPRPSNDLSTHSSRVVHRLAQAGAVEAPSDEDRNDIGAQDYTNFKVPTSANLATRPVEIPQSTVSMGRQFLRQKLRGPKKAVQRTVTGTGRKFEQEPLGMDFVRYHDELVLKGLDRAQAKRAAGY